MRHAVACKCSALGRLLHVAVFASLATPPSLAYSARPPPPRCRVAARRATRSRWTAPHARIHGTSISSPSDDAMLLLIGRQTLPSTPPPHVVRLGCAARQMPSRLDAISVCMLLHVLAVATDWSRRPLLLPLAWSLPCRPLQAVHRQPQGPPDAQCTTSSSLLVTTAPTTPRLALAVSLAASAQAGHLCLPLPLPQNVLKGSCMWDLIG